MSELLQKAWENWQGIVVILIIGSLWNHISSLSTSAKELSNIRVIMEGLRSDINSNKTPNYRWELDALRLNSIDVLGSINALKEAHEQTNESLVSIAEILQSIFAEAERLTEEGIKPDIDGAVAESVLSLSNALDSINENTKTAAMLLSDIIEEQQSHFGFSRAAYGYWYDKLQT